MTLYRRVELPPEPWTHEDNPEWILVEHDPMFLLVPVAPCVHGNYDGHWQPVPSRAILRKWCDGAGIREAE